MSYEGMTKLDREIDRLADWLESAELRIEELEDEIPRKQHVLKNLKQNFELNREKFYQLYELRRNASEATETLPKQKLHSITPAL